MENNRGKERRGEMKEERRGKRKEEREVQLEKINGKKDVKVEEPKEEEKNRN